MTPYPQLLDRDFQCFTEGCAVIDDQNVPSFPRSRSRLLRDAFAQQFSTSCHHVGSVIRFADIVVGARMDAANTVSDLRFGGEHDDGYVSGIPGRA